jgi:hypothetical protein
MITRLFDWFLTNDSLCAFGHCMVGVISATMCIFGYPETGAIGLFSFICYEALEQFRYQQPKDDADTEIRQALMGFNFALVIGFIVKALV